MNSGNALFAEKRRHIFYSEPVAVICVALIIVLRAIIRRVDAKRRLGAARNVAAKRSGPKKR